MTTDPTTTSPDASAPDASAPAGSVSADDLAAVKRLEEAYATILAEMRKAIVGQEDVIDQLLISIFARGHCLLIGVPGLAKTLMIRTLADALTLDFNRIQFTPDLMPSDITGTEVIQEDKATGDRQFKFIPGPIFANVILADEINRTPPKTQAALLESMQEFQVTAGGTKHSLEQPFFVLATQNPIEQEGTYPLPEAQQDRFMFNINVGYPTEAEELEIMRMTTATYRPELKKVLSGEEILRLQEIVRKVPVAESVIQYAVTLARLTRTNNPTAPEFVKKWVAWGAGPRASQYLILGAKARAVLRGRYYASTEDVRAVAHPVLRHRIICSFSAEAEGVTSDKIIDQLLELVPSAESATLDDRKLAKVTA